MVLTEGIMNARKILLVIALFVFVACDDGGSTVTDGGPDTDTDTDTDMDTDTDSDVGSQGCGESPDGLATSLMIGNEERTFVMYVPDDYDPGHPYPLIFAWHGLGGSGSIARSYFGIEQQVGSDAIIVYPDALVLEDYGNTGWNLSPTGNDFAFFDALYDHLLGNLCVDTDRVFSTGHSFGGYMSNYLGCYRADVLSAIAPVAGGPPWISCDVPIAAWITHGTNDGTVDFSEGEATRDKWVAANSCDDTSASTDPDPCVAYDGCDRDVHWCVHDGGHEWPGFAGAAIWQFFEAQ